MKAKLSELLKNPQFDQELNEHLATYHVQRSRIKNVAVEAQIEAPGNVHMGDKGTADDTTAYDEKNVIKGGSIKSGQDFHLGDDSTSK